MSKQFVRFVLVGCVGFCIDAGLTYALSSFGLSPLLARIPAIALAILATWLLNRLLTFEVEQPRSARELMRYFSVAILSAVLNYGVYTALVLAGVLPLLAVAIATLLLMCFSFFGYKLFAFRMQR